MLRETRITIALSKGINDISIVSLFAAEITAIIRRSFPAQVSLSQNVLNLWNDSDLKKG